MAGLLTSLVTGQPIGATYAPWDDFWFQRDPLGQRVHAGVAVSPESAMKLSAVYACVTLLADVVGYLPLILYRRLEDEGKERATDRRLYTQLRRRPNVWQTASEWKKLGMAYLLLRGNFYNLKILDSVGRLSQLIPLHPDRMRVTQLESYRRGYLYQPPKGPQVAFTQDEICHVMGYSNDGITGISVVEHARESVGNAQAQQGYAGRYWASGAERRGALVFPGSLTKTQREANRDEWHKTHAGVQGAYNIAILEGGLKFEPIGLSARDSQYIEIYTASVGDIARFFRVPPHMIGDVERSTSWGTGIEQQTIGFINFTELPWLTAFEQAIDRDVVDDDNYFVEFLVDALLRGDMASRSQAHALYIQNGVLSENEVRRQINYNAIPGLDRPQRSANQGRTEPDPGAGRSVPRPSPDRRMPMDDEEEDGAARARTIVGEVAGRLVRKEIAALRKWQPRYASSPDGWQRWVAEFYGRHIVGMMEALCLHESAARRYGAQHCTEVLERGLDVLDIWEREAPAHLARLALEEGTT